MLFQNNKTKSKGPEIHILVTGASGFLGSHIVWQLLEAGYRVTGTARGAKVGYLRDAFSEHGQPGNFSAVELVDISSGNFSEILKDIDAIIHTASYLPSRKTGMDLNSRIKLVCDGTLHLFQEAAKADVKTVVFTSSMINFPPGGPYGWDGQSYTAVIPLSNFNPVSPSDASKSPWAAYALERTASEEAVWEWKEKFCPGMDIISSRFSPSWIYGPLIPSFPRLAPQPDYGAFSSTGFIYALLRKDNPHYPPSGGWVDVRDVAQVHIDLLRTSREEGDIHGGYKKRFITIAPSAIVENASSTLFKRAVEIIALERSELEKKGRLVDANKVVEYPGTNTTQMNEYLAEALERLGTTLGTKEGAEGDKGTKLEWKLWKETVLDTVDSLISVEEAWKSKGWRVEVPDEKPMGL
ncbi:hypothetical protein GYMLUDRAFT_61729 [Collybiopsis luxurians FD-317 M1]|uniref:NAD-dependent epimerase/dehydratase domain-containing protein n=1 Tax=Collybiopsis luxurians FD-317 M1 TaxID=944289 RepID=A0A0D0CNM5_9AGAR|nr:hypothetical protein GYMLUDRAFT_61729 [Collybiopsis luxurians FD-317 M1]